MNSLVDEEEVKAEVRLCTPTCTVYRLATAYNYVFYSL